MKKWFALPIAIMIADIACAQTDPWANLRVLEGKWEGPTSGKPGKGLSSREYRFELSGRFLSLRNKSVWAAKSPVVQPEVHEDFSMLSYDTRLKKIVWRQFHTEGFVNEYIGLGERGRKIARFRHGAHREYRTGIQSQGIVSHALRRRDGRDVLAGRTGQGF